MYIGVGIFLMLLGLLSLTVAPNNLNGIPMDNVGWICLGLGVLAIVLSFILARPRRLETSRTTEQALPNGEVAQSRTVVEHQEH